MKHILYSVVVLLLLNGCTTTTPSIQEYTINSKSAVGKSIQSGKSIRLATTKSAPSLMTKNITYIHSNGESGTYLYSRWSDMPAVMIERAVSNTLHEHSLFKAILPSTSIATADWLIESDLASFNHSFDATKQSYGVIDITYRLIDPKTKNTISTKRFFIEVQSESPDAKGGVQALNKATHVLTGQLIFWLDSTISEKI